MGRVVRTGLWVDMAESVMVSGLANAESSPPEQIEKSMYVAATQLLVQQVARSGLNTCASALVQNPVRRRPAGVILKSPPG